MIAGAPGALPCRHCSFIGSFTPQCNPVTEALLLLPPFYRWGADTQKGMCPRSHNYCVAAWDLNPRVTVGAHVLTHDIQLPFVGWLVSAMRLLSTQ